MKAEGILGVCVDRGRSRSTCRLVCRLEHIKEECMRLVLRLEHIKKEGMRGWPQRISVDGTGSY